jgi:hypothetical protein
MPHDGATSSAALVAPPPPPRGVPITQIQFPRSPSRIPGWTSEPAPVYTTASAQPYVPPLPSSGPVVAHGGLPASGVLCGGVDGPLFHGGSLHPSSSSSPARDDTAGGAVSVLGPEPPPPKFYKLEFQTYDGSADPLNWLNHREQFFQGQWTLASDWTWLASYHLRGEAQTWYYALEQDEGMPPWERFRDLCRLHFGPPLQGSRLAELGRLPFTSTMQEYAGRFQAVACHTGGLSTRQRAELFVGGLPDHIRVDVEMRSPSDL